VGVIGCCRQDLYFRINVIELPMPSLRQRAEDIPLLVEHFLRKIDRNWKSDIPRVDLSAQQALRDYRFPGNVRELENILERAITLCDNNLITTADLKLPNAGNQISGEFNQPFDTDNLALDTTLGNSKRSAIMQVLEKTRYNKTAAAKLLGLTFHQLRYRIKKLGIE